MSSHKPRPNVTFECETCRNVVSRYQPPYRGAPRFCSTHCRGKAWKGHKQSPEHVAARIRSGAEHPRWKGDAISVRGGRSRALRMYPVVGPCVNCGAAVAERHHIDDDTSNNDPSNIGVLCRKCHMTSDGRLAAIAAMNRKPNPDSVGE